MKDFLMNEGDNAPGNKTEGTKPQEMFTKPVKGGIVEYIEREVDKFDYEGYEVVRREFFSKANCPAVTIKYGKVNFNVRAIRKLNECSHILILMNFGKKRMMVKPCDEDDKDSLQWSRIDKHKKVIPRTITGKAFTAQLFADMKWDFEGTMKMLGTLLKCKDEKLFIFNLMNAEAYFRLAAPSADDPNRHERVPLTPSHWQGNYGQSYEESKIPLLTTFEGIPEGFVKITLPPLPAKKKAVGKVNETLDLFSEQNISNTIKSNENMEAQEDGTR
jgi:hypothetical protein